MTSQNEDPVDHERLLRQAMGEPASGGPNGHRAPTPEELAPHFPDYEILNLVGRGGMGAVYRARQKKLDRVVALKILPRELAAEPEFGERFAREARALAALNHPHVLTVHDFGEVDGLFYLVTEFVDGLDLRRLMELGELSPSEALRITPQICQALQYAHEHGVVHRDIKPENILIDTNGQVKIADFGLAKLVGTGDAVGLTRSTAVFGTPHYMAPEQWRGSGHVDHRADIFSLGVVLYEMLTGQLPIGSFDPPSKRAGVPSGLDAVVQRALAQAPENRYQSAREVETDVDLQARAGSRARRAPPARASAPDGRFARMPFVTLGVTLLGLVAAAALFYGALQQQRAWSRYLSANQAYRATIERMAERSGSWDEPVPTPPEPAAAPDRWMVEQWPWALAGAAGFALLIVVLGFWSVHRIRASAGALRGMGLAVFTAWMVPLAIANALLAAPIVNILNSDTREVVTVFAVPILAAGTIAFLVWQRRRQLALAAAGPVPARHGPFVAGVVAAALLLCAAGIAAGVMVPRRVVPDVEMQPVPAVTLLGASRADVLARLGSPLEITVAHDSMAWSYRGITGAWSTGTLDLSGDRVVSYEGDALVLTPNRAKRESPFLGQDFADLVAELGPPSERIVGSLTTEMVYAGRFRVRVAGGVIVGVSGD